MRERTRILFVTGDGQGGQGKATLNLVAEHEAIKLAIQGSRHRDEFELGPPLYETRRYALVGRLAEYRPHIVHFGGHGIDRHLFVLDEHGRHTRLSAEEIQHLFRGDWRPRLVVLSACHSLAVAGQLAEHVEFTIGTEGELGDSASLAFARIFYQCVGNGASLTESHRWAIKAIEPRPREDQVPQLLYRGDADGETFRFSPRPLDPIEPFLDCPYWIRKLEQQAPAAALSDRQLAEILVYSLQLALYLGLLRRLNIAAESLRRAERSVELINAQRLVKWVVAFNEETRIRPRRPRLSEVRDGLADDWPAPGESGSVLSKWLEIQRADWLGLTYQRLGDQRAAAKAHIDYAKARHSFEAAADTLASLAPDGRDPVRLLWGGFIALNLAQVLKSLQQIPAAQQQMSDAVRLRRAARSGFADHKIEAELAEQLHLELCLAQLGCLELGAGEQDGKTDEELWHDIARPLKARHDHWKGIWKHVSQQFTKIAAVRGWDGSRLKELHDQADHSKL